jgi:hypothetical protein
MLSTWMLYTARWSCIRFQSCLDPRMCIWPAFSQKCMPMKYSKVVALARDDHSSSLYNRVPKREVAILQGDVLKTMFHPAINIYGTKVFIARLGSLKRCSVWSLSHESLVCGLSAFDPTRPAKSAFCPSHPPPSRRTSLSMQISTIKELLMLGRFELITIIIGLCRTCSFNQ